MNQVVKLGSVLSMGLLYPLDTARLRLQVDDGRVETTMEVLRRILDEEGWEGIYRGSGPVLRTLFCSYYVYFFAYNKLRSLTPARTASTDLLFSLAAAAINVVVTAPLFVVQTRIKLQGSRGRTGTAKTESLPHYKGLVDGVLQVYRREGLAQLWRGTVPSLLLCTNPGIQMMLYESLKRAAQLLFNTKDLGAMVYFVFGAVSKCLATVVTYPLQVLQSRMRSGRNEAESKLTILDAMTQIVRSWGVSGLFKGLEAKLLQTVLNAAFMFMFYEKIFVLLKRNFGQSQ